MNRATAIGRSVRFWAATSVAAGSTLLAVTTAVLWLRSVFVSDYAHARYWTDYPDCDLVHTFFFRSYRGGLEFMRQIDHFVKGDGARLQRWKWTSAQSTGPAWRMRPGTPFARLGFYAQFISSGTPPSVEQRLAAPHWFVLIVLLIPPALWLPFGYPRLRSRRRIHHGLCAACGYDLRASADRCPECGQASAFASNV